MSGNPTPYEQKAIRPPTTILDDGNPSSSCRRDMDRVLRLIEDERHFTAQELLHDVQRRLGINTSSLPSSPSNDSNDSSSDTGRRKIRLRPFQHNRQQNRQRAQKQLDDDKDHVEARQLLESNQDILKKLEVRKDRQKQDDVPIRFLALLILPCNIIFATSHLTSPYDCCNQHIEIFS
jgi:hypothetical protein